VNGDWLTLGAVGALALAGVTRRGSRSQAPAKYVVLATTGDVNPTEYGGGWVYRHPQGHLLWVILDGLEDNDNLVQWSEGWSASQSGGYVVLDPDVVAAAYPMPVYVVHVPDPAEVAALMTEEDALHGHHRQVWIGDAGDLDDWRALIIAGDPKDVISALDQYRRWHGIQNLDPLVYKATTLELYQQFPHLRGAVLRPTLAGMRWVLGDYDPYHATLEGLEEIRQEMIQDDWGSGPARQLEQDQIRKLGALLDRYERPLLLDNRNEG